jgi:predicted SnoaL-like aldol condensation-catalyzing enzyme
VPSIEKGSTVNTPWHGMRKAARILIAAVSAGALLAGASSASAAPRQAAPATPVHAGSQQAAANKALVLHVFGQLFNRGNLAVIDTFVRPDYIQHNPTLPTGAQALRDFVTGLKASYPDSHVVVKHALAEGNLVILHSNFVLENGSKGTAVFDIFRIQHGKIAEHWDVLQQVPDSTVNGHTMFSTLSTPRLPWPDPHASTTATKQAGTALLTGITAHRDVTAYDRHATDPYYQHNPQLGDGITAAKQYFTSLFAAYPDFSGSTKRVIAEGDYVAVHSHIKLTADDPGLAVVDLLRVRNGKAVEHWDVVQPVPTTSANDNTMF